MDSNRFDRLARIVGAGATRRAAVTLLSSLGLSGVSLGDPGDAWARSGKCKPDCGACQKCKKGKCEKNSGKKVCKKGKCKPLTGMACGTGGICESGSCACPSGTESCAGA